ncbi:hypothetical protein Desgi_0133 [Desulfoscipio gibsoniae DSM 7213]|uniref:Uncharacterized protein n=1 Tax=Desulfoscipio gibsoniae DSM 7213 TaxID=767817 RepID=R4KDH5_9FIRM|nr:hypothetical protein Desgi_0133 [Desulfoscipio gibsoniae DSM 7213]
MRSNKKIIFSKTTNMYKMVYETINLFTYTNVVID